MERPSRSDAHHVLVASWLGSTNLGDELLFRALAQRLEPYASAVTAISVQPQATEASHGVRAVGHRDLPGLVRAAGAADAFVFGGGDLIQDITSAYNLPYHLGRVVLARTRGLPVAGVGLGLPPLSRRWSPPLVRAAWPAGAPMAVRDTSSQEVARNIGIDASLAADLVFGLDPPNADPEDVIVVSLRPWHGGGRSRASASWREGFDPPVLAALAGALDRLSSSTGMPLRFVAFQPDRDGPFHEAVADRLTTADATLVHPTVDTVLDEMTRSRLVVSTRYHGVVAGLLGGRPVVGLSYADKVSRLAADAPRSVAIVDYRPDAVGQVASAGTRLLEEAPDVDADRERLRERETQNGRVLASLLG